MRMMIYFFIGAEIDKSQVAFEPGLLQALQSRCFSNVSPIIVRV